MSARLHQPETLEEATSLRAEHGSDAAILAGGTAFILLWQAGLLNPGQVVSLGRIRSLRSIRVDEAGLWLGAMATHRDVEKSPVVGSFHPSVAETFGRVATVRIRNQATVGGNLAHADPAHDPPPTLLAFDSVAVIASAARGVREVPLDRFFLDYYTTALQPTDVLTAVRVPRPRPGARATYLKYLPRTHDDYPTVSVGALAEIDRDGRISHIRVALGGVAPTPIRAFKVERALRGTRPTANVLRAAAAEVADEVAPLGDSRGSESYKRDMARVWVERALVRITSSDPPAGTVVGT